jgi:hypothetical protein
MNGQKALKKTGRSPFFIGKAIFGRKTMFLEEKCKMLIDRMRASPYDFVLAAEHAATSSKQ